MVGFLLGLLIAPLPDDWKLHPRLAPFRRLDAQPDRPRTARCVAALASVDDGEVVYETTGAVEGEIAKVARGTSGFGYDPIFYYPPYGKTLAEVSEEEKIAVAHRGIAFRNFAQWLARGLP